MDFNYIIQSFTNDPYNYLLTVNYDELISLIKYLDDHYYNGESLIDDQLYDMLIDTIKVIDKDNDVLKKVGHKTNNNKVKLPYIIGSMNKIKDEDTSEFIKWFNTFDKPYIFSSKLDGLSGVLHIKNDDVKLMTRGDGYYGSDITHLIKYINGIPNIKKMMKKNKINELVVRGELIISKDNFNKYSDMSNARNMVSGLVHSKKLDIDRIKDIDYITYDLIYPWIHNHDTQLKTLKEYGFNVVYYDLLTNKPSIDNLLEILDKLNKTYKYEMDGLIINSLILPNRSEDFYPDYAFAFKSNNLLESVEVKVINVEWNISKDGYIKPKLKLEPVKLSGVIISNVTANNAKYIMDNKLGSDSIVRIVRSGGVIPKIIEIVKQSKEAQMPTIEYKWNETKVDIIAIEDSKQQLIKNLTFFCKTLEIKNVDEAIIEKFIDNGINSINKIMTINKKDLEKIPNFKERMIEKIYNNIMEKVNEITLKQLMVASNSFGHGIGTKKISKFLDNYPDVFKFYRKYEFEDMINLIKEIEGFDTLTSEMFVDGLDNFIILYKTLDKHIQQKLKKIKKEDKKLIDDILLNKKIIFSGFRNKEWEDIIIKRGGLIVSSVSKLTNILVSKEKDIIDSINAKIIKAKQLNIQIMTDKQFYDNYIIYSSV